MKAGRKGNEGEGRRREVKGGRKAGVEEREEINKGRK